MKLTIWTTWVRNTSNWSLFLTCTNEVCSVLGLLVVPRLSIGNRIEFRFVPTQTELILWHFCNGMNIIDPKQAWSGFASFDSVHRSTSVMIHTFHKHPIQGRLGQVRVTRNESNSFDGFFNSTHSNSNQTAYLDVRNISRIPFTLKFWRFRWYRLVAKQQISILLASRGMVITTKKDRVGQSVSQPKDTKQQKL